MINKLQVIKFNYPFFIVKLFNTQKVKWYSVRSQIIIWKEDAKMAWYASLDIDRCIHLSNLILLHSLTAFQRKLHKFWVHDFFPLISYIHWNTKHIHVNYFTSYFSFKNNSIGVVLELCYVQVSKSKLVQLLTYSFHNSSNYLPLLIYGGRRITYLCILDAEQNF